MRELIFLIQGFLLAATASPAWAQRAPEVDGDEVIRRGDMVERIDGYAQEENPIAQAVAPPEDDSNKWFITVVTQNGCAPCERLKADFANARELQAFVNTEDHRKSWAHYNVYSINDVTQKFRFEKITLTGYPTILIQPPNDHSYGDPKTVVFQKTGYDGNAKKLSAQISQAIKRYAAKVRAPHHAKRIREQRPHQRSGGRGAIDDGKADEPPAPEGLAQFLATDRMGMWGQVPLDEPFDADESGQEIEADPPFPLPDEQQPGPVGPRPLIIPSPLDPDAEQPKPADESAGPKNLPKDPTCYVLGDENDGRVAAFIKRQRERFKNLVVTVLPVDQAPKVFPNLDKNNPPAVIVVDDGKVQEQVTQDNLPIDLSDLPWSDILAILLGALSGNPVSWVAVGAVLLQSWRVLQAWRAKNGKRIWVPGKYLAEFQEWLQNRRQRDEPTEAPKT